MKKWIVLSGLVLFAGSVFAGDPVVSNVRASQRGDGSMLVDIYYNVVDSDGDRPVVRVAISNGGAPVPATKLSGAVGDCVTPGFNKQIVWDAGADWSGQFSENVRVSITADDESDYMMIDLSGGPSATNYPVSYLSVHPSRSAYFTEYWWGTYSSCMLLMRKIPKGTFVMGSPTGEMDRGSDETQHTVTLTKDFYIGVYEVTQSQWELVMGYNPSYYTSNSINSIYSDYPHNPVEGVSYYYIRGSLAVDWPASSAVHAASFMGKLRAKTGLSTFDLPTEAQWEYACRAGTTTALNSGNNLSSGYGCQEMDDVGWYYYRVLLKTNATC